MADVFISYARRDEAVARRVAKSLQAADLEVWWDAALPAHGAFSEAIERNLEQAKAVVVLWSKASAASQWVRAEADVARTAGKLVQAQLDGTTPPLPFNQIQCANLRGWRGSAAHPGWTKVLGSVRALVSGEDLSDGVWAEAAGVWSRFRPQLWWAAAFLLLVAALALFLFLRPPAGDHKPVLAVLPFKSLDSRDENLVAGMWEDTRQAIGRNPQLIVLGPNTSEELAQKSTGAARKTADYLLQASIRTAGDRIRVSAGLMRTSDEVQVWSQSFDRKLNDVFQLQSEIAGEIEGRIRGRLAIGGGRTPGHIATTGELYAIYSDARAKIRKRDLQAYLAAQRQLQQVLKTDPNFAPAWAALAQLGSGILPSENHWAIEDRSEAYARKAIELAPNLATAHGALALALHLKGPVARAEVERAIELDPNDYEGWLWLGNMRSESGDNNGALEAYRRALAIEPLFWPAVLNTYSSLKRAGDKAGIGELIDQQRRLGADNLATAIRVQEALARNDLAGAANLGLAFLNSGKSEGETPIAIIVWDTLLRLGFYDEAVKVNPAPPFAPLLWKNDPKGLDLMEADPIPPRIFFVLTPLTENAGRVYLVSGRGGKLAAMYRSLKLSPAGFEELLDNPDHFLNVAPLVAIALRQSGDRDQAAELLSRAEAAGKVGLRQGDPAVSAQLARIYAVQGRKDEAISLLAAAVGRGWLPQPPVLLVDLAVDPALSSLRDDPRFERVRQQVLTTIARERARVRRELLPQPSKA